MSVKILHPGLFTQVLLFVTFIAAVIIIHSSVVKTRSAKSTVAPDSTLVPGEEGNNPGIYPAKKNNTPSFKPPGSGHALEPALLPPTEGYGGPVLVISSAINPFSRYIVEILRAEGLNCFKATDISWITPAMLDTCDVVLIGEVILTNRHAAMLSKWVYNGGTLIAFRPDTLLAPLLGIKRTEGILRDKYLLIRSDAGPGAGITDQVIQFHGAADLYTLNGAASIATLYADPVTATAYPAITATTTGPNGGVAVAFTYDLAKSVIYTRQGNPGWAGQKRDGHKDPIRSDDLFFPDWIDMNKVAIPQADEQQRLLINIILQNNLHRKPLPRFWYLPGDLKAAIVMTGDDHGEGNTTARFLQYMSLGPNTPEDIADWRAIRATSYIYPHTKMTNAQAIAFENNGFEIALHANTNCLNYSPKSVQEIFTKQLLILAARFPGISPPVTNRTHCLTWSDWSSIPQTELQHDIRMDASYYYWPASWVQNRPGMFTGSGFPMRFADIDGSIIDNYQLVTQMTDESGIDVSAFCDELLSKATGPEGYYGVFCANMHMDSASHAGSDAIIASAKKHQVPVISAKQLLAWMDGRNHSFFAAIKWNGKKLGFHILARNTARNLKAMLPLHAEKGRLMAITRDGRAVPFTVHTIKGIQYAIFPATAGRHIYVADYSGLPDGSPGQITVKNGNSRETKEQSIQSIPGALEIRK